jgi:DNA anti-recombination protein RmuC
MDALGKSLGTVNTHYENLSKTRKDALEKPMDRINELELGQGEPPEELSK